MCKTNREGRDRFKLEHDICLLTQVVRHAPYHAKFGETRHKWELVAYDYNQRYNRSTSWKTLQNRVFKLLSDYQKSNYSPIATPQDRQFLALVQQCHALKTKVLGYH